jgi:hypothetical protein
MITFYVSNLPPNYGGIAYGPVVLILEKYRNDAGLLAHERFHVKQWWAFFLLGFLASLLVWDQPYWYLPLILGAGIHAILYLLSDKYKLWSEVRAYRKQAEYYADDRKLLFAGYISKYYKLNISTEDAYKLLKD